MPYPFAATAKGTGVRPCSTLARLPHRTRSSSLTVFISFDNGNALFACVMRFLRLHCVERTQEKRKAQPHAFRSRQARARFAPEGLALGQLPLLLARGRRNLSAESRVETQEAFGQCMKRNSTPGTSWMRDDCERAAMQPPHPLQRRQRMRHPTIEMLGPCESWCGSIGFRFECRVE